jgi:hypothetical protein
MVREKHSSRSPSLNNYRVQNREPDSNVEFATWYIRFCGHPGLALIILYILELRADGRINYLFAS